MKTRLDQYTMAQFIDIVCGDRSHIDAENDDEAQKIALGLISAYNEIADPVGMKSRMIEREHGVKHSGKLTLLKICFNLMSVYGAYDDVRSILGQYGLAVGHYADDRLKRKVEQLIRSEEAEQKRAQEERKEEQAVEDAATNFRASYDRQTARLMAHFKMPIDHNTISASIYANLVNMACSQQRQQAVK